MKAKHNIERISEIFTKAQVQIVMFYPSSEHILFTMYCNRYMTAITILGK